MGLKNYLGKEKISKKGIIRDLKNFLGEFLKKLLGGPNSKGNFFKKPSPPRGKEKTSGGGK